MVHVDLHLLGLQIGLTRRTVIKLECPVIYIVPVFKELEFVIDSDDSIIVDIGLF